MGHAFISWHTFWLILLASYIFQGIGLFSVLSENELKSKLELAAFLTPFLVVFGILACIFYGSFVLIKKFFKLPNKAPSDGASDEVLEALDVLLGVSFDKLPLFVNHKNPVIQEFVQMKLRTGTLKKIK